MTSIRTVEVTQTLAAADVVIGQFRARVRFAWEPGRFNAPLPQDRHGYGELIDVEQIDGPAIPARALAEWAADWIDALTDATVDTLVHGRHTTARIVQPAGAIADRAQLALTLPEGRRMLGAPIYRHRPYSPAERFALEMDDTIRGAGFDWRGTLQLVSGGASA